MDNKMYVEQLNVSAENKQKCLDAMAKYGDSHWWEDGGDMRTYAYHQLREGVLLGEFGRFKEAVELLVGHPVWTHQFVGDGLKRLLQESEEKYKG